MSELNFDLGKALSLVVPGAHWRLTGNSLSGLIWLDDREIPSLEVLENAIKEEHNKLKIRKIWASSSDFWGNFQNGEKLAILLSNVPEIILLREELRLWIGEVWSDDPKVQSGLGGLVAVGIISEERKSEIISK